MSCSRAPAPADVAPLAPRPAAGSPRPCNPARTSRLRRASTRAAADWDSPQEVPRGHHHPSHPLDRRQLHERQRLVAQGLAPAAPRPDGARDPEVRHAPPAPDRPVRRGARRELPAPQRDPGRHDGPLRPLQEGTTGTWPARPSTSSICCSTSTPRSSSSSIDAIAERVQMLGGISVGDPRHAAELTTIPRPPDGAEEVPVVLSRLLDAHETIIEKVRKGLDATEENKDWGTQRPADGRRPAPPRDAGLVPGRAPRRGAARRGVSPRGPRGPHRRCYPRPRDHDPPDRRRPPRRLPRGRGLRVRLLGARRGDDGHPRGARRDHRARPPHHDPPRAGRRVHGRRLRPPDRPRRRRDGDARAGRDEPRHRHRRRLPRPRADGRDHRPGVLRQAPQGGPPGRRHRRDVRAGHEVEHPRRADRGDPRDRPQGVPGRDAREARPDPHRAAREPRRRRAGRRPMPRRSMPGQTYFPEPTDEAIAHAADLIATSERPIVLAGNGVLRRRRVAPSCGRSRAASTSRSRPRSWARARSTTARTCR